MSKLKTILLTAGAAVVATPLVYLVAVGNTYSEGLWMGELNKYSEDGPFTPFLSGEGELQLGNESAMIVKDASGRQISPQPFSSTLDVLEKNRHFLGQHVVLEYDQQIINWRLLFDTDYRLISASATNPSATPPTCEVQRSGWKSAGEGVGRFVKASTKGYLFKTWEVKMQIGNSGGQFRDMSIIDPEIWECAQQWLRSGKRVKATYSQDYFRNPLNRDTNVAVVKIEPAAGGLAAN